MRPDPDTMNPDDEGSLSLAVRPPPYPIEAAMEEAMVPEQLIIPQDREPDPWDDQPVASAQPETNGSQSKATEQQGGNQPAARGSEAATGAMQPRQHAALKPEAGETALETGNQGSQQPALVIGADHPASSSRAAPAPANPAVTEETVPETLTERLRTLPKWQARYVASLYELGGISALAASRNNVSLRSVEKAMRENPNFAEACAEAVAHRSDLVVAATFKGATVGDLRPKWHQGILVGYERRRDTKAAELMLKLDKKIEDGSGNKAAASVTLVQVTSPEATVTQVADAMRRIYEARATSGRVALPDTATGDR